MRHTRRPIGVGSILGGIAVTGLLLGTGYTMVGHARSEAAKKELNSPRMRVLAAAAFGSERMGDVARGIMLPPGSLPALMWRARATGYPQTSSAITTIQTGVTGGPGKRPGVGTGRFANLSPAGRAYIERLNRDAANDTIGGILRAAWKTREGWLKSGEVRKYRALLEAEVERKKKG